MIWNNLVRNVKINKIPLKRFMSSDAFQLPSLGVNPAYDQAIEYLNQYSKTKLDQAKNVEEQLKDKNLDQAAIAQLKEQQQSLLAEAYIHFPETKHKFTTGNYNVEEPVFKHLKLKQWNEEISPIIKQRVEQMFVAPDVVHPQSDYLNAQIKLSYAEGEFVDCGKFIDPEQSVQSPKLEIHTFHKEVKHYTLVMVDPDYPNEQDQSYLQKAHWIIKNIPLSLTNTEVKGDTVLNYIPPHPAQGTEAHRYTMLLLEQPTSDIAVTEFNSGVSTLFEFIEKNQLTVRGTYFFRSKWSPAVSSIYKDILKIDEPFFGPQPVVNPLIGKDGKLRGRFHNI